MMTKEILQKLLNGLVETSDVIFYELGCQEDDGLKETHVTYHTSEALVSIDRAIEELERRIQFLEEAK